MEAPEIEYIYNLRRYGMKLDLSIMREFIKYVGNPHESLRFAHIGGTNGKGSVSYFLYSIMKRKHKTALYTSPHVERYNERIIVDDKEIEDSYIKEFVHRYRKKIDELAKSRRNPTFFEVTTTLALKYFKDMQVDFVVLEVGLGGRLDATNIVMPDITAIVTVDKDHTKVLGKRIRSIAREKAGIIKPKIPVVVGEEKKNATKVIKKVAERNDAPYHNVYGECSFSNVHMSIDGMNFVAKTPLNEYEIRTKMVGYHQIRNILVAIRMAEILSENYTITKRDIEEGISGARWRDRFEVKRFKPLLIFDSAHNPAGARVLADTITRLGIKNPTLLFSMLKDKDIKRYLQTMKKVSGRIIITEIDFHRKMPIKIIEKYAKRYFREVIAIKNSCDALKYALQNEERVVACGSIYLLGELEKCLRSSS